MDESIDTGRRTLIAAAPFALLPGATLAQPKPERATTSYTPEQNRALDAALGGFPMVLHGPGKRPDLMVVTARRCGYCRLFHREFPEPPRGKTFGYIVGAWATDTRYMTIPLYREPTLANFRAYMDGGLTPPAKPSEAELDLYFGARDRLIAFQKLGYTGTPAILLRTRNGWHLRRGFSLETGAWLRTQL